MTHTVGTTLPPDGARVTLELINPEDLPTPPTYTHVVIASGSRLVIVAGQEPEDEHGNLVGPGDLAVQARQAKRAGWRCSAITSRPTHWSGWSRCPTPTT